MTTSSVRGICARVLYSRIAPLIAAAAAVSCTPYDPELGAEPFLCGSTEPRCPDGYVCVERIGADKVCLREDVVSEPGCCLACLSARGGEHGEKENAAPSLQGRAAFESEPVPGGRPASAC